MRWQVLTTCNIILDFWEHTKQPSYHDCLVLLHSICLVSAVVFSPVPTGSWGQSWTPSHLARVLTLPRLGSYSQKTEHFELLSLILIAMINSAIWCYELYYRTADPQGQNQAQGTHTLLDTGIGLSSTLFGSNTSNFLVSPAPISSGLGSPGPSFLLKP